MAKKIGIVLALDGEQKFTAGMANATKQVQLNSARMKNLSEEYKNNANSLEYLQQKQKMLETAQQLLVKKVGQAAEGHKNATKIYQEQKSKLEELQEALKKAEKAQDELKKAGKEGSQEYKDASAKVKEYSKAVEDQGTNALRADARITDWSKRVTNAEADLRKTNKELIQNAKYIDEAAVSSDKCATSIDKMGKEVKEAGSEMEGAGKKTSTFKDVLAANLTGAAIVGGLKKAGEAAKEAAKYVVEVGSSFEAAMSDVEAISGATGGELSQMEEKAKALGSSTKFSATEVANGFKYMSLAGWSTTQMLDGIDGVLNLAAASGMELAEASDMVTDYLSAFGMEASEAGKMADMMAYAQANSNTSAQQMGEAYGNCAADLNAAGQDIETTTSLLEGMANQGRKGSEAGTQLSAIMRDITSAMKNGEIAIGDTSVKVMDANGDFRDLTDILADVEKATDGMGTAQKKSALSTTFTARSMTGLNLILNEGMDKISGYEESLRHCDGAAAKMAETMNDNLKGDVVEAKSALEGLGIAAYEYVDGPLRGVVQGVTGVINSVTDAITPQRTELDMFIDDVKQSNEEIKKTIENAKGIMSGAESDVTKLEAYKQTLMDLNSETELTEFQKYQLAGIVNELADTVPGLTEAFNEESGSLKVTNEELEKMFKNAEGIAMQKALIKAQAETYELVAEATLNKARADSAAASAQEEYDKALEESAKKREEFAGAGIDTSGVERDLAGQAQAVRESTKEQEKANAVLEEAQETVKTENEALEELRKTYGLTTEDTDDLSSATGELGKEAEETSRIFDEFGNDITNMSEEQAAAVTEASREIAEAYQGMRDSIADSIKGSVSLFEEFSGGTEVTAEQVKTNLDSQIEGISNWEENMTRLAGEAGSGMTQEFYDYLMQMGPESANLVQMLVDSLDNGTGDFEAIAQKWTKAMELQEDADVLAGYTSVGEGIKESIEQGLEGIDEAVAEKVQSKISSAAEKVDTTKFQAKGPEMVKPIAEGIENDTSVNAAFGKMAEAGISAITGKAEDYRQAGVTLGKAVAEGMTEAQEDINNALSPDTESISGDSGVFREAGAKLGRAVAEGMKEAQGDINNALKPDAGSIGGNSGEYEAAGAALAEAVAAGMEAYGDGASQKMAAIAQKALDSAKAKESEFLSAGQMAMQNYANGMNSGAGGAVSAASNMASRAMSAANSYQNAFYNAGANVSHGMASGINAGASGAINAAASMAARALAAAKRELDIRSPSKKFRNAVGKQVGKGFALGIKDSASLAGDEAAKMSMQVYTKATKWLAKYKDKKKTTLADEKYFWQQITKHTQTGTDAYNKAAAKMVVASVSPTTKSGKKEKNKDTETYYSEIYSAAQKYLKNQQVLNDWSLQQELSYWKQIKGQLKKGTQAWYDATAQINGLQAQVVQAAEDAVKTRASVQDSILNKYKTYYKVSAKAEMDYWDLARQQFTAGTDERIEADQKYFDAQQSWYDERQKLDEDYAKDHKAINDKLVDDVKDLQDAYKDAVKSRKDDILSQMNLFEAWDSTGYDADTLLYNLKTQVSGLALWEKQLEELGKKGLATDLMDELKAMGPDAAASIYSLNQMTAEQLKEYSKLWAQKNALAESQAVKENAALKEDTNKQINDLKNTAQAELNALNKEYRAALAELNAGISADLRNLVGKAGNIGEEAVSGLVAGIGKAANSVDVYNSTTAVVDKVSGQLGALADEGKVIGGNTLDGILEGMLDNVKIESASQKLIQSIKRAMEEEAEIHSPARLFKREIGFQIPAGVAGGMEDGIYIAEKSAENMMQTALEAARGELDRQQAELQNQAAALDYTGIKRLNDMMSTYGGMSPTVNVDNSGVATMMDRMLSGMEAIIERIENMGIYLDTGVIAGQMQPQMSRENAAAAIRARRGRL